MKGSTLVHPPQFQYLFVKRQNFKSIVRLLALGEVNAQAGVTVGGPGTGAADKAVGGRDIELLKPAVGPDSEARAAPRRWELVGIGAVHQRIAVVLFVRSQPGAFQLLNRSGGGGNNGGFGVLAGGSQQERCQQQPGRKRRFGHGNGVG